MVTLLWTGLNVLLLLLIVYAWFRVLKVLRRELGLGLAVLFLLSLVLRGNPSAVDSQAKNLLAAEPRSRPMGNWSTEATILLNLNNQLHLHFEGHRTDSTVQVHGMYSSISGLMLGHQWKPLAGMANSTSQGISYEIFLMHEWKLLGIALYTNSEEYTGIAAVDK